MSSYTITKLGQRGDGIATGPIYAPLTVPGDVVEGALSGDRLQDIRITTPSDLRVKPPCRHFKSCGGCAVQHVRDDYVADWKAQIVTDALAAAGLDTDVRPTITSPPASRRRATFAARRTKSGALLGFHARASDTVIDTPDCQLVRPALLAVRPLGEALAHAGASRKHGLDLTVTETLGGLDIAVAGGKALDTALQGRIAQLAEEHRVARITWNDEVAALRAPSRVRFDGIDVPLPPGAFLQATTQGEEALRAAVVAIVGNSTRIIDLFAGCGTFALPLARRAEILAVEGARVMAQALEDGWRNGTGLKRLQTRAQDLFRNPMLPDELDRFDAAVIDPPRAGAIAQIKALADSRLARVAHVSCNPQTFARDAQTLVAAGFGLDWVQPVDQFRWSPHVELVGAFTR